MRCLITVSYLNITTSLLEQLNCHMIAIADINHLDFLSYLNCKIGALINLTCYLF